MHFVIQSMKYIERLRCVAFLLICACNQSIRLREPHFSLFDNELNEYFIVGLLNETSNMEFPFLYMKCALTILNINNRNSISKNRQWTREVVSLQAFLSKTKWLYFLKIYIQKFKKNKQTTTTTTKQYSEIPV